MLIGIDGNEANVPQKVGVGQYAFELLWHLYKLDKTNNYLIYLKESHQQNYLRLPKTGNIAFSAPVACGPVLPCLFIFYSKRKIKYFLFSQSLFSCLFTLSHYPNHSRHRLSSISKPIYQKRSLPID